jgi:hypothetical protein
MRALQFFLNTSDLEEYVEKFYGNGLTDLEVPEERKLSDYDFFLIQFKFEDPIIEEVWGVIPQGDGAYGERIGFFQYENVEWVEEALTWLKEKVPYNVIDE